MRSWFGIESQSMMIPWFAWVVVHECRIRCSFFHKLLTFFIFFIFMCGIFAYRGAEYPSRHLIIWLYRLEYRGYDSAWLSILGPRSSLIKAVGNVKNLDTKTQDLSSSHPSAVWTGIAHTRWATHGKPTDVNTHPHTDATQTFRVVHNGIIENYHSLKELLITAWYIFQSQTDTEVIPHLLAQHRTGDLVQTVHMVIPLLRGSFALAIHCTHQPDVIVLVKWGSPLIAGKNTQTQEFFASSDMQALAGLVHDTVTLEDGDIAWIDATGFHCDHHQKTIVRPRETMSIEQEAVSKQWHPTFMRKEIAEQPAIIKRIWKGRWDESTMHFAGHVVDYLRQHRPRRLVFVWCGTSYHACMQAAFWTRTRTHVDAHAVIASEYIHDHLDTRHDTIHVFLSQSGETADSLIVLKKIQALTCKTIGIVNVVGSSIGRLTDAWWFLRAGTEIGVASSKAFTAQMMTCLMMIASMEWERYDKAQWREIVSSFDQIPHAMQTVIDNEATIATVARAISQYSSLFFLARWWLTPLAAEGSLKYKELTYHNAQRYPAGELKHGPLACISEQVPTIFLMPYDQHWEANCSTMQEIVSRQGKICVISDQDIPWADWHISLPSIHPALSCFPLAVAVQLVGYHSADTLGRNIDKPRNLAKSVTVT